MRVSSGCIAKAFSAKRRMECPNCRQVEEGEWGLIPANTLPQSTYPDDVPQIAGIGRNTATAAFDSFQEYLSSGSSLVNQRNDFPYHEELEPAANYLPSSAAESLGSLSNYHEYPYSYAEPALTLTSEDLYRLGWLPSDPSYHYAAHPTSYTRGGLQAISNQGYAGSRMNIQPYPDIATRTELRSNDLNNYILQARNQGYTGSSSNHGQQPPQGR